MCRSGKELTSSVTGHTEATSGLVSVIKCILMLERGIVLPNANFEVPNPALRSYGTRLAVSHEIYIAPAISLTNALGTHGVHSLALGRAVTHIYQQLRLRREQRPRDS